MKSEILKLLREAEDYVSGQELCDRFSVSRTAVWKVMNQLKEEGYSIEAVRNKGYHMIDSPDVLNRETVKSHVGSKVLGRQVVYFDKVDSTNVQAKMLGDQLDVHGTVVVADQQVSGKGRRGRNWESPQGTGIFMSLVLKPAFAPKQAPMLTLVMAYSVAKALQLYEAQILKGAEQSRGSLDIKIKWPNDIIINGKKVCGILTEMSTEIDYINYVVIGVGVNVNMMEFPQELQAVATSLKLECGSNTSIKRAELIGLILGEFEVQYERFCEAGDLTFMTEAYNSILVNKDKEVRVLEPGNEYEALAVGIDEQGELLVRRETGEVTKVYAGEVSVRGVYGYV